MSKLIQMRQRIKAIETIKKITHAMRLISMSSHTQLRNKKTVLNEYQTALNNLFHNLYSNTKQWHHYLFFPEQNKEFTHTILIIIGSQKGLCGSFNTNLFTFFEKDIIQKKYKNISLILIGKKATDYFQETHYSIIQSFPTVNSKTMLSIAEEIINKIMQQPLPLSTIVYSNTPHSFFIQKSIFSFLIPLTVPNSSAQTTSLQEKPQWEQPVADILLQCAQSLAICNLQKIILDSLIAEQAARFVAMDSSTRNAKNVLAEMQLEYNKTRQALITRELTDLSGSF